MALRRFAASLAFVSLACQSAHSEPRADDAMIEPYVAIASALSQDSTDGIEKAAAEIEKAAAGYADKPGIARLVAATGTIAGTDLAGARKSFKRMSDGMIEYMRATPASQAGRVIVHCPMAFSHQGAQWVQHEGKIANPYHGSEMLRCGNKLGWTEELPPTAKL
jgi:hypothetical protein